MDPKDFTRTEYAILPTPIYEAKKLADTLGLGCLLIKRDDNTGLAMGGNKARKLEFLIADAQQKNADIILTCGGIQSNHVRMTAAAACNAGLDCIIFIPDTKPDSFDGNLLLDAILGAEIRFLPGIEWEQLEIEMDNCYKRLKESGRKPYLVPVGGSTPIGALGYVNAAKEAEEQLSAMGIGEVDMVVALGSGGTASGLMVGTELYMPNTSISAISVVSDEKYITDKVVKLTKETSELIGIKNPPDMSRLKIYMDYVGKAYGTPTQEAKDAILMVARKEGIILDPVYTGKAMAGLIDLAKKKTIGSDKPVLFWHTGGAPALFANIDLFRDEIDRSTISGAE